MKVALVVPGGVDRSGAERVIPVLLWHVERIAREHELHVFALRQEPRPARWALRGAAVHNVGWRPTRAWGLPMIVREHLRAPFDVLHAVWAGPGTLAAAAGRLLRRPVLLHMPGGDLTAVPDAGYGRQLTRAGRLDVRMAVAGAARVTVPSDYMLAQAHALGIAAERLTWGVCTREWPPLAPRRREPDAEARLLFVATLNRVKDPWTVVRAARHLADRGVRFRLDVAGADILGGEIQRLAAELGVADRVHFHGFLVQSRLRPLVERADLLLLASRHEGDPMALLEAAVAGVPTVATPVGHAPAWAPEAASVVPQRDPAAMAAAVAELLEDEERRLRMAAGAQRRALAWDADRSAARILEIYREITTRGRPPDAGSE